MVKRMGMVIVGATLVVAHCLIGGAAFADSYTQDGKPCPPECVSDSLEIVTWYPSPYNEYEELRLYPKRSSEESQCNSFEQLGLMYYNQDEYTLKICRQDPDTLNYSWQKVGGGNNESGTVFFSSGSPCPAGSITVGQYYHGNNGGLCTPSGGWVRPGDPAPCCYVEGCGTHSNCSGWTNCASPTNDYLCAKQ